MHASPDKRNDARSERALVVLFDGDCDFCAAQAGRLLRLARNKLELRSFREEGVLQGYPELTREECTREMKLIGRGGRIFGGAEAIVRAIETGHPLVGKVLFAYYIPGIRWLADRIYAAVARNRYRLPAGRRPSERPGSCRRHPH